MIEGTLNGRPISECPPAQIDYMRRLIRARVYVIIHLMVATVLKAVQG